MTPQELIDAYWKYCESNGKLGAYWGYEDAGFAYRSLSDAYGEMAALLVYLTERNVELPDWLLDPVKEPATEHVSIVQTWRGFELRAKPDCYRDGDTMRVFRQDILPTLEEARESARDLEEVILVALAAEQDAKNQAVNAATAHIGSQPGSEMRVFTFGRQRLSRTWWNPLSW